MRFEDLETSLGELSGNFGIVGLGDGRQFEEHVILELV
jgi:hypothetical protein